MLTHASPNSLFLLSLAGYPRGTQSADQAAQTPLFLCLSPTVVGETGRYFRDCKVAEDEFGSDGGKCAALWQACESKIGAVVKV